MQDIWTMGKVSMGSSTIWLFICQTKPNLRITAMPNYSSFFGNILYFPFDFHFFFLRTSSTRIYKIRPHKKSKKKRKKTFFFLVFHDSFLERYFLFLEQVLFFFSWMSAHVFSFYLTLFFLSLLSSPDSETATEKVSLWDATAPRW